MAKKRKCWSISYANCKRTTVWHAANKKNSAKLDIGQCISYFGLHHLDKVFRNTIKNYIVAWIRKLPRMKCCLLVCGSLVKLYACVRTLRAFERLKIVNFYELKTIRLNKSIYNVDYIIYCRPHKFWYNWFYECLCVSFGFPLLSAIKTSWTSKKKKTNSTAKVIGLLSNWKIGAIMFWNSCMT